MLVANCPGCGRPTPVSLGSPDTLSCRACGRVGPSPPAIAAELRAADAIVRQSLASHRQLSASQRRAVASAGQAHVGFLVLLGVSLLPALATSCLGALAVHDGVGRAAGALVVVPLLVTLLACALVHRWVATNRRNLEDACAATPPAVVGAPCTCRTCGAPLTASTAAIERCTYCAADNVVRAAVLARAAHAERATATGVREQVQASLARAQRAATRGGVVSVLAGLVALPIGVATTVLLFATNLFAKGAPDPNARFMLVAVGERQCVADVTPRAQGAWSSYSPYTTPTFFDVRGDESIQWRATWLVGRDVLELDKKRTGTIIGVGTTLMAQHFATVRYADGTTEDEPTYFFCLVLPEPPSHVYTP
jgi:hypothetical protein